ncbi:MAG TPA: 50S ribosomal protein L18 [Nanoarchaeota archaeon]|nr:50S ribosomal protein L18 [Nanoarchaeota archaeon]
MKRRKRFIPFRRKLEGKTDYRKRLAMLKSGKLRLVIRKSLNNISAQLIGYENAGDKVFVSAHSRELLKLGWKGKRKNMPAAYLVGLLCGVKAKQSKITEAILDAGFYTKVNGSVVFSALKGAVDAGLKVPHDAAVLPKEDRVKGKHIKNANIEAEFEAVKKKILGGAK